MERIVKWKLPALSSYLFLSRCHSVTPIPATFTHTGHLLFREADHSNRSFQALLATCQKTKPSDDLKGLAIQASWWASDITQIGGMRPLSMWHQSWGEFVLPHYFLSRYHSMQSHKVLPHMQSTKCFPTELNTSVVGWVDTVMEQSSPCMAIV